MTLHLFNPGHDEALAADTPYYTDTLAAQRLATDLRTLPRHWAAEGDTWTLPDDWAAVSAIAPWGWDAALVHRLRRAGAPERLLPDAAQLAAIRRLSSRATAVRLLPMVSDRAATWCATMTDAERALSSLPAAYVKAPWSSSGRGIVRTRGALSASESGRIGRWLRQQGAVVVEPAYDKAADFAVEYEATPDGVRYEGLSLFLTEGAGAYAGNLVAEEGVLRSALPPLGDVVQRVARALEQTLEGRYCGPLGVDMMLLADGTIHPCVEVNLRRTMGWVALRLRRYLPSASAALRFCLRPVAPLPQGGIDLTSEGKHWQAVLMPATGEGVTE